MFEESYAEARQQWIDGFLAWHGPGGEPQREEYDYWEWVGDPPQREFFMPGWTKEERTHYQMYETTSEGTPISPVMATPEQLAAWLAENDASAFGNMTATYEQWLKIILRGGTVVSMVCTPSGGIQSGVEYERKQDVE
jgi:hypothetical protein